MLPGKGIFSTARRINPFYHPRIHSNYRLFICMLHYIYLHFLTNFIINNTPQKSRSHHAFPEKFLQKYNPRISIGNQ